MRARAPAHVAAAAVIALCIIYNHSFIKNVEVLDRLYSSSFDRILHIVPNHRSVQKDILTAYRSSHVFQGYLADNRSTIEALGADYIVFAADDCLLNCRCIVDEVTVGIDRAQASGFFPGFAGPLAAPSAWKWAHTLPAVSRFFGSPKLANPQIEGWLDCLPDLERARSALGRYDAAELRLERPTSDDLANYSAIDRANVTALFGEALAIELPFPFVRGLADFGVLHKDYVAEFLHYCGVFSSLNLWVEVAIPTAAALLDKKLVFAKDLGLKFDWDWSDPRRSPRWPQPTELRDVYRMVEEMPRDLLFRHPVKLSEVTKNLS
jgi:hypothetical protein